MYNTFAAPQCFHLLRLWAGYRIDTEDPNRGDLALGDRSQGSTTASTLCLSALVLWMMAFHCCDSEVFGSKLKSCSEEVDVYILRGKRDSVGTGM